MSRVSYTYFSIINGSEKKKTSSTMGCSKKASSGKLLSSDSTHFAKGCLYQRWWSFMWYSCCLCDVAGILISTIPFVWEWTSGDELEDKTPQAGRGSEQKPSKKVQKGCAYPLRVSALSFLLVIWYWKYFQFSFQLSASGMWIWQVDIARYCHISIKALKGNHEMEVNSQKREYFLGITLIG